MTVRGGSVDDSKSFLGGRFDDKTTFFDPFWSFMTEESDFEYDYDDEDDESKRSNYTNETDFEEERRRKRFFRGNVSSKMNSVSEEGSESEERSESEDEDEVDFFDFFSPLRDSFGAGSKRSNNEKRQEGQKNERQSDGNRSRGHGRDRDDCQNQTRYQNQKDDPEHDRGNNRGSRDYASCTKSRKSGPLADRLDTESAHSESKGSQRSRRSVFSLNSFKKKSKKPSPNQNENPQNQSQSQHTAIQQNQSDTDSQNQSQTQSQSTNQSKRSLFDQLDPFNFGVRRNTFRSKRERERRERETRKDASDTGEELRDSAPSPLQGTPTSEATGILKRPPSQTTVSGGTQYTRPKETSFAEDKADDMQSFHTSGTANDQDDGSDFLPNLLNNIASTFDPFGKISGQHKSSDGIYSDSDSTSACSSGGYTSVTTTDMSKNVTQSRPLSYEKFQPESSPEPCPEPSPEPRAKLRQNNQQQTNQDTHQHAAIKTKKQEFHLQFSPLNLDEESKYFSVEPEEYIQEEAIPRQHETSTKPASSNVTKEESTYGNDYINSGMDDFIDSKEFSNGGNDNNVTHQETAQLPVCSASMNSDSRMVHSSSGQSVSSQRSHRSVGVLGVVCCSVKKGNDDGAYAFTQKSGIPVHRLTPEELSMHFPKIRIVSDESKSGSSLTSIVTKGQNYAGHIPAHLQVPTNAFLPSSGPQSLFEYEYDEGQHADAAYFQFGPSSRALISVRRQLAPPQLQIGIEQVIVQVEASTISLTDCIMRRGDWWGADDPPFPVIPGTNIVGKITQSHISSGYRLSTGQRVLSLTKWGGNSRFISLHPDRVIKISESVDPAEAACLTETYLSAFQVVHIGQKSSSRYKRGSLKDKSILILGSMNSTLGQTIIEIALVGGVQQIYATSKPKHFVHLRALGVTPLDVGPMIWLDQLRGKIDLVIATGGDKREDVLPLHFKVLRDDGHLIVVGHRVRVCDIPIGEWESPDKQSLKTIMCKKNVTENRIVDRTHAYDLFRQWDRDLELCKRDLSHLVELLEKGKVKPKVLDRIPLTKVAKAQELIETRRYQGHFVCEPWLKIKKRAAVL